MLKVQPKILKIKIKKKIDQKKFTLEWCRPVKHDCHDNIA